MKKKVEEVYDVAAIISFADFTNENFSKCLHKVRDFSTFVNECKNPIGHSKKDYTDSILSATMLDCAFRKTFNNDTFVLVSGDGHFSQTLSTLKRFDYKVDVIGFESNLSKILLDISNNVYGIYKSENNSPLFAKISKDAIVLDTKFEVPNECKKAESPSLSPSLSSALDLTEQEIPIPTFNNYRLRINTLQKERRREHKEIRDKIKKKCKNYDCKAKAPNDFKSRRNKIFTEEIQSEIDYDSIQKIISSPPPLFSDVDAPIKENINYVIKCIKSFEGTPVFPIERFLSDSLMKNYNMCESDFYFTINKMIELELLTWENTILDSGKEIQYAKLNTVNLIKNGFYDYE